MNEATLIADDAWAELQRSPYIQAKTRADFVSVPDVSFDEAQRRSRVGHSLLTRLSAIDFDDVPHDLALTLRSVRFHARIWSCEADWYWTVLDPCGIGLFGMFLPTAYCGGYLLNFVHQRFASLRIRSAKDVDRYHQLISGYARLIDQFAARTAGQAERAIVMPRPQIAQARTLLMALKSDARAHLRAAREEDAMPDGEWAGAIEAQIAADVEPAFDRALAGLSEAYCSLAPDVVGMGQYPRGAAIYAELVKLHTTLDLTPEQVHASGLTRLAEIEVSIGEIRKGLGFGDETEFVEHLNGDPHWRKDSVAGVTALFQRYIERAKPWLNDSFAHLPKAPYGVAPLPDALQGAMTYGYYDPPKDSRAEGLYLFNELNLTSQSLYRVATLTFHELMPGHHLQIALQLENSMLHPFRAHSFVNAYAEGWAEYAATWAGEIGLYGSAPERYGRLAMDAFFTCRLVVDTGMNVLGWSLERAREFMRRHARLTEAEILTESVRYSCDIPAQSLAYKLGDTQILALRDRMQEALGQRFALKDFHAAILEPGALPMPDLEWHVEHEIQELTSGLR